MSERKPLLASLKDTVETFSNRKTVGRMKTEHSIFIPSSLMINQEKETEEFVKSAKHINNQKGWFLPVSAEKVSIRDIAGIEFVFEFSPDTDFDAVISYINSKLSNNDEA